MARLLTYEDDFDLNQDITQMIQLQGVFCICCLKKKVPYINLLTCSHTDFLNGFGIPQLKPENQIVCQQCHEMLKKIQLFKLQVGDSFKLLVAQENKPESCSQINNFTIVHRIVDINIPQTDSEENDQQTNDENIKTKTISEYSFREAMPRKQNKDKSTPKSTKEKNMKNIQEALKIINNNKKNNDCFNFLTTSLQSIAGSQLTSLTKTLLNDYNNIPIDFKVLSGTSNVSNTITSKTIDTHSVAEMHESTNIPNHTLISQTADKDGTNLPVIFSVESDGIIAVSSNPIMANKTTDVPDDAKMLTEPANDTVMNENIYNDETNVPVIVKVESDGIIGVCNDTNKPNRSENIVYDKKMLIEATIEKAMSENNHKVKANMPVIVKVESDGILGVSNNTAMLNKTADMLHDAMLIETTNDTKMSKNNHKDESNLPAIIKFECDGVTDIPDDTEMLIEATNDTVMNENINNDETNVPVVVKVESDGIKGVSNDEDTKMVIESTNSSNDTVKSKGFNKDVIKEASQVSETRSEALNGSNVLTHVPTNNATQSKLGVVMKTVKLTKEELMQERSIAAESKSYINSAYRCKSCIIGFNYAENYDDHVRRKHTPSTEDECYDEQLVKKQMRRSKRKCENIQKDKSRNTKRDCDNCEVCLQVLYPWSSSDRHTYLHYTRLECFICGKRFGVHEETLAIDHYNREHTNIQKCQQCTYMTHNKDKFNIHMFRKHGRPSCTVCGVRFNCPKKLKSHVDSMHGNSTQDSVKQAFTDTTLTLSRKRSGCKKVSAAEGNSKRKKNRLKQTGHKIYSCKTCNKGFSQALHLDIHRMRIHPAYRTGLELNSCPQCEKGFMDPFSLEQHLTSHLKK